MRPASFLLQLALTDFIRVGFSDILSDSGGLKQNDPTIASQTLSTENASRTLRLPNPFEHALSGSLPPEDTTWSNDTWDYAELFLTEMGHRDSQPTENNRVHGVAPEAAELSEPSLVNNAFTLSDAPTAYNP